MPNALKKLVLKRETVRTLTLKTGLRTGDAAPDIHSVTCKGVCVPDTSAPTGSGGGQDTTGGDNGGGKVRIIPVPGPLPPIFNIDN